MVFSTRGTLFWMMFGTLLLPIFAFVSLVFARLKPGREWVKGLIAASGVLLLIWIGGFGLGFLVANATNLGWINPRCYRFQIERSRNLLPLHSRSRRADQLVNYLIPPLQARFTAPGTWITLFLAWYPYHDYPVIKEEKHRLLKRIENNLHLAFQPVLFLFFDHSGRDFPDFDPGIRIFT